MIKIYGIKNCDTVKKALKQLELQQVQYNFVDIKLVDLSTEQLDDWILQKPDTLINKRSTTYRQLKEQLLAAENDLGKIIELIKNNPTLIKRPLLEKTDGTIHLGYDAENYSNL